MGRFFIQCRSLILFLLVTWLVLSLAAWLIAGVDGLVGSTISSLLALGCGILSIGLFCFISEKNRIAAVMGIFALRLFLTLAIVLVVKQLFPAWGLKEFYSWLIVVYLVSLAWETRLFLAGTTLEWSWLLEQHSRKA